MVVSKEWSITRAQLLKALPNESAKDIALAFDLDSHGDKKHILESSDIRGVVKKLARSSNTPATIDRLTYPLTLFSSAAKVLGFDKVSEQARHIVDQQDRRIVADLLNTHAAWINNQILVHNEYAPPTHQFEAIKSVLPKLRLVNARLSEKQQDTIRLAIGWLLSFGPISNKRERRTLQRFSLSSTLVNKTCKLSNDKLTKVARKIGAQTRLVLLGESHISQDSANIARRLLSQTIQSGKRVSALAIEADWLYQEQFDSLREVYKTTKSVATLRKELRKRNHYSHLSKFHLPKGVIANNIVPVYNPALPSRRWSAYEDLIVYVIKNDVDIVCIDRHDKNDAKTRDEIMEATLDTYANSKGGWAKVRLFALMGSWHVSTAIDKKMSAQGAASSDIDRKPLGYRFRKRFGDHLLTVGFPVDATYFSDFKFDVRVAGVR